MNSQVKKPQVKGHVSDLRESEFRLLRTSGRSVLLTSSGVGPLGTNFLLARLSLYQQSENFTDREFPSDLFTEF